MMKKEVTFCVLQHEKTGEYVADMEYSPEEKELQVNGTKRVECACAFDWYGREDTDGWKEAFEEQGFKVVDVKATYELNVR